MYFLYDYRLDVIYYAEGISNGKCVHGVPYFVERKVWGDWKREFWAYDNCDKPISDALAKFLIKNL